MPKPKKMKSLISSINLRYKDFMPEILQTHSFQENNFEFKICFTGKDFVAEKFHLPIYHLKQIHSDRIINVDQTLVWDNAIEGDALFTNKKNICLGIRTADCVPILLWHANGKIAAVHAGWRGTAQNITVKTITKAFAESEINNLHALIGPAICGKHYEVGSEVKEQFHHYPDCIQAKEAKYLIDLPKINQQQLLDSGVPHENIEVMDVCTFENEKLFSYRRSPQETGRNYSLIYINNYNNKMSF